MLVNVWLALLAVVVMSKLLGRLLRPLPVTLQVPELGFDIRNGRLPLTRDSRVRKQHTQEHADEGEAQTLWSCESSHVDSPNVVAEKQLRRRGSEPRPCKAGGRGWRRRRARAS